MDVHYAKANTNPSEFIWDENKQQLVVLAWPTDLAETQIYIKPGIHQDTDPAALNNTPTEN